MADWTTKRVVVAVLAGVVVVGVLAFVGVNLWLDSGEAPEEFSASDAGETDTGDVDAGTSGGRESADASTPVIDVTGEWSVELVEGTDSGVGYRILEDVPIGGPEEVAARTQQVSGSLEIDASRVSALAVTAQLGSLASGNDLRDSIVASDYLEVESFPTAEVTLAEQATLELPAAPGELVPFAVPAELTIHGVTQPVTVDGEGQWIDDGLEVVGAVDITLSQFGVERPSLAGRSARDEAVVEFKLRFVPAGG